MLSSMENALHTYVAEFANSEMQHKSLHIRQEEEFCHLLPMSKAGTVVGSLHSNETVLLLRLLD